MLQVAQTTRLMLSISSTCPSFFFGRSFYSFFYAIPPFFIFLCPHHQHHHTTHLLPLPPILDNLSVSFSVFSVPSLSPSLSYPNSILPIPPSTLLHLIVDLRVVAMSTIRHITMATSLSETRLLIRERSLVLPGQRRVERKRGKWC